MPSMFYKGLAHAAYSKRGAVVVCLVLSCVQGKIRVFCGRAVVISEFDASLFVSACKSIGTQDCMSSCVEVDWSHLLIQGAASIRKTTDRPMEAKYTFLKKYEKKLTNSHCD